MESRPGIEGDTLNPCPQQPPAASKPHTATENQRVQEKALVEGVRALARP